MRVQFHEVIGFVILGVLLLAGVYVQISGLYHEPNVQADLDAQGVFVGRLLMEEHILEDGIAVDSLHSVYVSQRDNKASTSIR